MEREGMFFSVFEANHPDAAEFLALLGSLPPDESPDPAIAAWLTSHPESQVKPELLRLVFDIAHSENETVAEVWFDLEAFAERFLYVRELVQREIIENNRMPPELGPLELWSYEENLSPEDRAAFEVKLLRITLNRSQAEDIELDRQREAHRARMYGEASEITEDPPAADLWLRSARSPLEAPAQ